MSPASHFTNVFPDSVHQFLLVTLRKEGFHVWAEELHLRSRRLGIHTSPNEGVVKASGETGDDVKVCLTSKKGSLEDQLVVLHPWKFDLSYQVSGVAVAF